MGETLTAGRLNVNTIAGSIDGRNVVVRQLGRVLEDGVVTGGYDEREPTTIGHGNNLGKQKEELSNIKRQKKKERKRKKKDRKKEKRRIERRIERRKKDRKKKKEG